jgi:predicted nucleic acid-binding protein
MSALYVIDTSCLIAYFHEVFQGDLQLSSQVLRIINTALSTQEGNIKLSIPSVVFIEIFEKWLRDEEFVRKFFYEVYTPIVQSPNIEIKPIDQEVLQALLSIRGELEHHDLHDKLILACAIMLGCQLITTDNKVTTYVNKTKVIPGVLN